VLASRSRVAARGQTHLPLLLVLLLAAAPAGAQVAAPKLVEDGEDLVDEAAPAEPPAEAEPRPGAALPGAPAAPPAGAGPVATPLAPAAAEAVAPAPATVAPEPPAADARAIEPVRTRPERLLALWGERRAALREGDPARAQAAQAALLAAQRELAIENLVAYSAAEVREVHRALASNLPAEALARADVAVALAPDHPDAHLARARALFATMSPPPLGGGGGRRPLP
jgi:hypothetical protein